MRVMRKLKKFRLFKSPFMMGSVSAVAAVVLNVLWPVAELLKAAGIVDVVMEVQIILAVGLIGCLALLAGAIHRYVKNGYIRKERFDELLHLKSRCEGYKKYIMKESIDEK